MRAGNEDLDPFLRFERFYIAGPGYNKRILVSAGSDEDDAANSGVRVELPLVALRTYMPRLKSMGFDVGLADELHSDMAWDQLRASGRIGYDPQDGLDIDVVTAGHLHAQLQQEFAIAREKRKRAESEVPSPPLPEIIKRSRCLD